MREREGRSRVAAAVHLPSEPHAGNPIEAHLVRRLASLESVPRAEEMYKVYRRTNIADYSRLSARTPMAFPHIRLRPEWNEKSLRFARSSSFGSFMSVPLENTVPRRMPERDKYLRGLIVRAKARSEKSVDRWIGVQPSGLSVLCADLPTPHWPDRRSPARRTISTIRREQELNAKSPRRNAAKN